MDELEQEQMRERDQKVAEQFHIKDDL